jgi:hypothetical protein
MREICASGSVGGEGGNAPGYPASGTADQMWFQTMIDRRAEAAAGGAIASGS